LQHVAAFLGSSLLDELQDGAGLHWALHAIYQQWSLRSEHDLTVFPFPHPFVGKCQNPSSKSSYTYSCSSKGTDFSHIMLLSLLFSAFVAPILTVTCYPNELFSAIANSRFIALKKSTYYPLPPSSQDSLPSLLPGSNWSLLRTCGLILFGFSVFVGVWKRYRMEITAAVSKSLLQSFLQQLKALTCIPSVYQQ
jgi:hypothetical protein